MSISRQLRRQQERNNKAELKKYQPYLNKDINKYSKEDINLLARMAKNGITPQDMVREIEIARKQAFQSTYVATLKVAYAAIAITLAEEYGFDYEACFKALSDIDRRIVTSIDDEDIMHEMEEKAGVRFNSEDGVERIERIK